MALYSNLILSLFILLYGAFLIIATKILYFNSYQHHAILTSLGKEYVKSVTREPG